MNCTCIETVNERLAAENLELDATFMLSSATDTLSISTHWKDTSKKPRGKKPMPIMVNYCPFCGVKAGKGEK